MSNSNYASINNRATARVEIGRRRPVSPPAAPLQRESNHFRIPDPDCYLVDREAQASFRNDDDDEESSGVATAFPEESLSKNGVRVRNYVITYYPGGETPIIITPKSVRPPEHYVQYMLKPTHKQFTFFATCLEVAPTTGRLHGHLYVELKEGQTVTWLKNQLGTTHIKAFARKGTQKQARDYVYKVAQYSDKDHTCLANVIMSYKIPGIKPHEYSCIHPYSSGAMKAQGARSDLDRFVDYAMNGTTHKEFLVAEQGTGLRYFKYFNDATEVFDGTHRSSTIRANKRMLYDRYCEQCDQRDEVPMPYYEFTVTVEADPKWSPQSIEHSQNILRMAVDEKADRDEEELQALKNKLATHGGELKNHKDCSVSSDSSDSDSSDSSIDEVAAKTYP